MALGSSAPEILLSLIETATTLGQAPGELGPSTIVGSAAFNLMVISAVSIVSVDGPKHIEGLGVFAITATASLFAYVWLWMCLQLFSKDRIEIWEAVVTLVFFFILLGLAYTADKIKACRDKKNKKGKPEDLRNLFDHQDFIHIMKVQNSVDKELTQEEEQRLKDYKEVLKDQYGTDDVSKIDPHELKELAKPASVIPRMKYRRKVGDALSGRKDLVVVKGMVYSAEERMAKDLKDHMLNKEVGFKCLHYSVTEGAGTLKVDIVKRVSGEYSVGVRTVDDTANAGEDYKAIDEVLEFASNEKSKTIEVEIVDDNEWEPDEDFLIELYDPDTGKKLQGGDTET